MRKTIIVLAAAASVCAAAVSCLDRFAVETDDIPTDKASYKAPAMGGFDSFDTTVKELSSLCLTKDGNGLWSVSDDKAGDGGVYSVGFNGVSKKHLKVLRDLEGVTINPATGDLYLAVEGEQAVYKVAAPGLDKTESLGTVANRASDPAGKGLEGITWYKNDTLLVANQASPTVISFFSIASGKAEKEIEIKFANYLSDLCYDPVDNVIWISDSNAKKVYICDLKGSLLASYDISSIVGSKGKAEGLTIDRAHSCIWIGCDVTDKLYKVSMTW